MKNRVLLSSAVVATLLVFPMFVSARSEAPEAARISPTEAAPSAPRGVFNCPNGGPVLINQPPNQSNGIFSDSDCGQCGTGQQSVAEDFVLAAPTTVAQIVFWGSYHPGNQIPAPPDPLIVIFHQDAGGLPGAVIDIQHLVPTSATLTGVELFGVDEVLYVVDITPVTLPAGTFWVEIYTNSVDNSDSFFWETGELDPVNGRDGTAFALETPGVDWMGTPNQNFALALCATADLVCPSGTVPVDFYFNDFETDDGGWTGGGLAPWEWGAVVTGVFEDCDSVPEDEPAGAFSGINVWATNLDGCHANSDSESLLTQNFDFSALAAPIQFSWWNWYEIFVPFDMGELIVNGGAPLFEVTTTAPTPDYVQHSVDLSAFAGNASVTIDFRLFATTVVNRAGWYIDDITIQFCAGADLEVEKTATVNPDDTVDFTITVTNNGPGNATGVEVTDSLPACTSYQSDDCGAGAGDPFTWSIGDLAADAVVSCTIMVDATGCADEDEKINTATVTADQEDPEPGNNTDEASFEDALFDDRFE